MSVPGRLLESLHGGYVASRRSRVLCRHLAELLPAGVQVLDVGCGDGQLAALVARRRPDLMIEGLDILARPAAHIPVTLFDGRQIPYPAGSVDVVMLVDTLHHADNPHVLLREAARVARRELLIKDHTRQGWLAGPVLRFMDDVGNTRHGVALPHTYWTQAQWDDAFRKLGLRVLERRARLGLYPWPADWVFERSLHFIVRLAQAR